MMPFAVATAAVSRRLSMVGALLGLLVLAAPVLPTSARAETLIRVGHFPNITHVQALVAHALSRQGHGWFEARLGPDVKIDWYIYNAGPSAMEAVFAGAIDLTYVGPSPALNAYSKSKGTEVRIVAGAATGGAALVVQPDSGLSEPADFKGKRLGTPQLGNTQDVSARAWLTRGGLHVTQTGGDVQVIPTANPDQLQLFKAHELDAVWTVEPWVSRLERDAGGKVVLEEKDSITTVLVSSVAYLGSSRELVRKFVAAHRELTDWIIAHPAEAQAIARQELIDETHGEVSADLLAQAWKRIVLTSEISREALESWVLAAQQAGFMKNAPDLARLVEQP